MRKRRTGWCLPLMVPAKAGAGLRERKGRRTGWRQHLRLSTTREVHGLFPHSAEGARPEGKGVRYITDVKKGL